MAFSTAFGHRLNPLSSTSTKTGFLFAQIIEWHVAEKVKGVVIMSDFFGSDIERITHARAVVALLQRAMFFVSSFRFNFSSRALWYWPKFVKKPLSNIDSTNR